MAIHEIEVGVVGVGHLGRHHARLYAALEGVRLVGVVDRDPERARSLGRRGRAAVLEQFTIDRMVEDTLAVYASLAGS